MARNIELPTLPREAVPQSREDHLLRDLLRRRIEVEELFTRLGHTYRHGRLYRRFEHSVARPLLKASLKLTGLYGRGIKNALSPVVRKITVPFMDLPSALVGFQILHLSDFHLDGIPGVTDALIPLLKELHPDICVMTGDYRFEDYGPCEQIYPLMRRIVSNLRTRFGTFGILGNHDSSEIAVKLERIGIRMLVNESLPIGDTPLWLIGVDDPFDYRCHDLATAMNGVPTDSFRILLAHAPEVYQEALEAGIHLYLSGHTHAGQIQLPGLGAIRRNARCPRALAHGLWRYKRLQGYTSAGIGCSSLPVRFGCPPEIALIELQSINTSSG
jgi:predicted MPP superfamily phosphohydrolase